LRASRKSWPRFTKKMKQSARMDAHSNLPLKRKG
jgi:hypothetical protein